MAFSPTRILTYLLYVSALALLLSLGLWQLGRGREKAALLSEMRDARQHSPMQLESAPADWKALDMKPAILNGRWLGRKSMLLANRFYEHTPGFDVYTPFVMNRGEVVMVNRGWYGKNDASLAFDDAALTRIEGTLYLPRASFTLGVASADEQAEPLEMQYYDQPTIERKLGRAIAPAVLILEQGSPHGLQYTWQPVVMTPQRHYAYAAQWFALAATLLVFGVIWLRRGGRTSENPPQREQ